MPPSPFPVSPINLDLSLPLPRGGRKEGRTAKKNELPNRRSHRRTQKQLSSTEQTGRIKPTVYIFRSVVRLWAHQQLIRAGWAGKRGSLRYSLGHLGIWRTFLFPSIPPPPPLFKGSLHHREEGLKSSSHPRFSHPSPVLSGCNIC